MVELGTINITKEALLLSLPLALPQEGHVDVVRMIQRPHTETIQQGRFGTKCFFCLHHSWVAHDGDTPFGTDLVLQ